MKVQLKTPQTHPMLFLKNASSAARLRKAFPPKPPPKLSDAFIIADGALQDVNIERVICNLIHPRKSDPYGLPAVLWSALGAYAVAPHNQAFVRDKTLLGVANFLARMEDDMTRKTGGQRFHAAHLVGLPQTSSFFDQIYYPLGGIAALRQAIEGVHTIEEQVRQSRRPIRYLVDLTRLLHIFRRNTKGTLREKDGFSFGKANEVLASGKDQHWLSPKGWQFADDSARANVGDQRVSDYWKEHQFTLPLLYAASFFKFSQTKTLLDAILDPKAVSFDQSKISLRRWLGIAEFASVEILLHASMGKKNSKQQVKYFTAGQPMISPPMSISAEQEKRAMIEFKRKTKPPNFSPIKRNQTQFHD